MTKVNHKMYSTPRDQRVREFVRGKMAVAFLCGYGLAVLIAIIMFIYSLLKL